MPRGHYKRPVRPIIFPIGPSIIYIELTRGQYALADAEDLPKIASFSWYASWSSSTRSFYAYRTSSIAEGRRHVPLHRALCPTDLPEVDHINGNTLDNRKSNLRGVTGSQNCHNAKLRHTNRFGAKGVCQVGRRYRATIRVNGRSIWLGSFGTLTEAITARKAAEQKWLYETTSPRI